MPAADAPAIIARLEQRLVELEVKLSFHERTIDDLDGVLRSFVTRVETLEREMAHVRGSLEAAPPTADDGLTQLEDDESP